MCLNVEVVNIRLLFLILLSHCKLCWHESVESRVNLVNSGLVFGTGVQKVKQPAGPSGSVGHRVQGRMPRGLLGFRDV